MFNSCILLGKSWHDYTSRHTKIWISRLNTRSNEKTITSGIRSTRRLTVTVNNWTSIIDVTIPVNNEENILKSTEKKVSKYK